MAGSPFEYGQSISFMYSAFFCRSANSMIHFVRSRQEADSVSIASVPFFSTNETLKDSSAADEGRGQRFGPSHRFPVRSFLLLLLALISVFAQPIIFLWALNLWPRLRTEGRRALFATVEFDHARLQLRTLISPRPGFVDGDSKANALFVWCAAALEVQLEPSERLPDMLQFIASHSSPKAVIPTAFAIFCSLAVSIAGPDETAVLPGLLPRISAGELLKAGCTSTSIGRVPSAFRGGPSPGNPSVGLKRSEEGRSHVGRCPSRMAAMDIVR